MSIGFLYIILKLFFILVKYFLIYSSSKFLVFILGIYKYINLKFDFLLCKDIFEKLCNLFIGISALIIAVVIFAIEKSGDAKNGIIFKQTLINISRVKSLITFTLLSYSIILVDLFIKNVFISKLLRIIVLFLLISIIYNLFKSFKNLISVFTDENEKTRRIDETLMLNIEEYAKIDEKMKKIYLSSVKDFSNIFGNDDYIELNRDYFFEIDNKYIPLLSQHSGEIVSFKKNNLIVLNRKIRKIISSSKNKEVTAIKPFILIKGPGDYIRQDEIFAYIEKDLIGLNILSEIIFNFSIKKEKYQNTIKIQILDSFQYFIDSVINKKIFDLKMAKSGILLSYKKVSLLKLPESGEFYNNLIEIYKSNNELFNNDITEISLSLLYISIDFDNFENFNNLLNLYFYLVAKKIDNNFSNDMNQKLYIIKKMVEKNGKIKEFFKYNNCILSIKQKMFKLLFDNNMYDDITKKNMYSKELQLYNVNLLYNQINSMRNFPEKYININLNEEIDKIDKVYTMKIIELSNDMTIYISIMEWARYKFCKGNNSDIRILNFIKKIANKFKYYNWDDLVEFYIIISNTRNQVTENWLFWELEEPENINMVINPKFSVLNSVVILLFLNQNSNQNSLKFKKYITKDNKYIYINIKEKVEELTREKFIFNSDNNFDFESKKAGLIIYLEQIIFECERLKIKYIAENSLPNNYNNVFKETVITSLEKRKKGTIIDFYDSIGRKKYSQKTTNRFYGYIQIEDKEYLLNNFNESILNFIDEYTLNLILDQSNKITRELEKHAINSIESINEIISKFKNINNLYILVPYIYDKFDNYDFNTGKYYYFYEKDGKKVKIPVCEISSLNDNIIIGEKNGFGRIKYFKYKNKIRNYIEELADEYTIAHLIDYSCEPKTIEKVLENPPKWLREKGNMEEYLKTKCLFKICQRVEYFPSKNGVVFIKKNI